VFDQFDLIHSYSRKQAIEDGILVDVTSIAKEAGIKYHTVLTIAVYERYVRVPEGVVAQDERGRLWDILFLLVWAIRRSPKGDILLFTMHVRNNNHHTETIELKAICGPNDDGSPCLTILLPTED